MRRILVLLVGLAVASLALPAFAQDFPKLTGRVVDAANIIPDAEEARLTQKLQALETQSQRQLVIATIPDLQGYDISDYGYRLGREWGIGDKQRNDGALLIVAPKERKVRIEVGYGLEPVLTDGFSWLIIDQQILPRFKQGDMAGGIEAGADAIIKQLTLPPEEAQKVAAQADQQREESKGGVWPVILLNGFILLFFIFPLIGSIFGRRGRRHRGMRSGPIIWAPGAFSGGSSGGFGGGFGGGFSGGGGSFGGGGASGGW